MWTLPDRALLCAFNTNKKDTAVNATIRVPIADLGLLPELRLEYLAGSDLEKGQMSFDPWNGTFTVNVLPHDYRLLVIRKYTH